MSNEIIPNLLVYDKQKDRKNTDLVIPKSLVSSVENLKFHFARKSLTEALEILENAGFKDDAAIFILGWVGGAK